jgi:hypothetical protein
MRACATHIGHDLHPAAGMSAGRSSDLSSDRLHLRDPGLEYAALPDRAKRSIHAIRQVTSKD